MPKLLMCNAKLAFLANVVCLGRFVGNRCFLQFQESFHLHFPYMCKGSLSCPQSLLWLLSQEVTSSLVGSYSW